MAQPGAWSEIDSQYKAPVPCYNCGSPDHLFNACPEPTRATPAGYAAAAKAKAAAAEAQPQPEGNGYSGQSQNTGYASNQGIKKYQGAVVTKYPGYKAPVITRYVPPSQYQSQQGPATYGPPNPQSYHQPTPPQPPQNYGQYGQNYEPPVSQPPPVYDQYNQHYAPSVQPPPPPPIYDQYGQQEYGPPQPSLSQQAPQHYPQYPPQNGSAHGYYNDQQQPYSEPQGSYQAPAVNQPQYNGYQQPDYSYQHPPSEQYQVQGPVIAQPTQWGQPHAEPYGHQQQNGQHFSAPAQQPYYEPPQQQYPYDGNYGYMPPSNPHDVSQVAPPVQPPQQYAQAQYDQPAPQYPSNHHHGYHHGHHRGSHQSGASNSQFMQSQYNGVAPYPPAPAPAPPNSNPNLARETRSASIASTAQGVFQPNQTELSDEQEIEWMLEMRLAKSRINKRIEDLTTDEYYSLLCQDTMTKCDPIREPLPDTFSEDLILPPVYNSTGVISKFVSPGNVAEFTKSIRDQSCSNPFSRDPAFLDVDLESWFSEFSHWVDQRRHALGFPISKHKLKSRKRASSSRGGDVASWSDDQHSLDQAGRNKRTKIDSSQGKAMDGDSKITSVAAAKREGTPSAVRQTTPSFDIGEVGQDGEDDPWAIEPGESSLPVDYEQPADHEYPPPKMYGNQSGNISGSQQAYYNKGPRRNSNGWNNQMQATKRKDSGYMSTQSSYTSSNGHTVSHDENHNAGKNGRHQAYNQTDVGPHSHQYHNQDKTKFPSPMSSDSDPLHHRVGDSPLTPTSTELVGQNVLPLPLDDQVKVTQPVKIRRRAPHVEEVYNRRW